MTPAELKAAQTANPFRPFTIRMADGRKFYIRHPDFLLVSPRSRVVLAYKNDNDCSLLDTLLMTEIEFSTRPSRSKRTSKR